MGQDEPGLRPGGHRAGYGWGEKADNDEIAEALANDPGIKAAICVLSETSTGTVNDIEGFARAAQNVVTIVDAVSGLEPALCGPTSGEST